LRLVVPAARKMNRKIAEQLTKWWRFRLGDGVPATAASSSKH